ncbi:hypothetical protein D3C71_1345790 [compost metagenome]
MARKCSTALVDPPVAMMTDTAFSMDSRVMMSRGQRLRRTASTSTRADSAAETTFSSSSLAIVLEYGRLMPMASKAELMVLAVYMPPQEPEPGMAHFSICLKSASGMRPIVYSPTASKTETMVRSLPL